MVNDVKENFNRFFPKKIDCNGFERIIMASYIEVYGRINGNKDFIYEQLMAGSLDMAEDYFGLVDGSYWKEQAIKFPVAVPVS